MNTAVFFCLLLLCVAMVITTVEGASKQTPVKERRRRSKEIEDKISKLDDSTKKRINAMKASGMPKTAIADKIAYEAGGKNTAKRIVDALHDEPKAKKYVPPTNKAVPKTAQKTANKPSPRGAANKPAPKKNAAQQQAKGKAAAKNKNVQKKK